MSLDQLAAESIGDRTRYPALPLTIGTDHGRSLSYTRGGSLIPAEHKPARLYKKLFVQGTPEEIERAVEDLRVGRSLLDAVGDRAKDLNAKLGARDRERMDQYFTSVRDLEEITRSIADQARTIRIPVHMIETINKMNRISRQILQETGQEPDPATLAQRMEMPEEKIRKILKISKEPISMETPIGDDDDSHLGDFIEDQSTMAPSDAATYASLRDVTKEVLDTLTPREAKVLRMRFGIEMSTDHTLEEVGKQFDVTRERIRQIEAKALRKLRHPSRSERLKSFLDQEG